MPPQPQPLSVGKGVVMMLFGLNKVGKTYMIGGGKRTLIIRPPDDHTDSIPAGADCEELIVTEWSEMFEIFSWLQQGAYKQYDWVWVDTISLLQDRLLEDVVSDMLMRRPDLAMDKNGNGDGREAWVELKKQGIVVPEYGADKGEYKINFDRLSRWVRDMVGISKAGAFNFGIVAHPWEWFDPTQDKEIWAPWIQGKNMIPKICGYMNIIAYLQEQKGKDNKSQRVLLVDAPGFLGGDQLECIPELKSGKHGIIDPTMAKVEAAIKKSPKRSGDASPAAKPKRAKKAIRRKR
jgi:hypothetical protein